MNKLIFATNNQHKVDEIKSVIGDSFNIISLKEAGIEIDIPEPYATLEENASEKSRVIHQITGENCFSEDSGLETDALNGAPGVKSARYAGEECDPNHNVRKLLTALQGATNRKARFRTVISLILNNTENLFEGRCEGYIVNEPRGNKGFGYDPVFVPEGSSRTFGEMDMEEKNIFSHRRIATEKLVSFLSQNGIKLFH